MAKILYEVKQNQNSYSTAFGKWFAQVKTLETLNTRKTGAAHFGARKHLHPRRRFRRTGEVPQLSPYVKLLIDTSRFITSRISDGAIVLVDKEIVGNLNFTRYEKK